METKEKKATKMKDTKSEIAKDLRALFIDGLKDIYWAENALTKEIPKMVKNTTSAKLSEGLNHHLEETKNQIKRLEKVFDLLGEKAEGEKCEAMAGLIKEASSIMEETKKGPVRDAGIIAAAQKVEHYEIATYGTLTAFAKTLGEDAVAELLIETLKEETNADKTLTDAAYNSINFDAKE
jgi:ferritin-like metal-binding protein YciE